MNSAMALARRIAVNPAPALRMTKRLLREAQHQRLEALLEMSAGMQALAHHTPEHDEAVALFLQSMAKK
jgi:enoyl-CoA hydratase/carnithine racemase